MHGTEGNFLDDGFAESFMSNEVIFEGSAVQCSTPVVTSNINNEDHLASSSDLPDETFIKG